MFYLLQNPSMVKLKKCPNRSKLGYSKELQKIILQ